MEIPSIDASNALQVQQLLVQQQQIQQQYVELINLVKQNPDQPTERLLEIESKINQLRATYTQIQQQLQALEYQSIQGQQNTSLRGQVPLKKIGLSGLLPHLFDVILLKTGPRISRGEFFLATLILSVIPILGGVIMSEIGVIMGSIAFIWHFVLMTKRFHDLGKSGWNLLGLLIPFYNLILEWNCLFKQGINGENKYGPDPIPPQEKFSKGSYWGVWGIFAGFLAVIYIIGFVIAGVGIKAMAPIMKQMYEDTSANTGIWSDMPDLYASITMENGEEKIEINMNTKQKENININLKLSITEYNATIEKVIEECMGGFSLTQEALQKKEYNTAIQAGKKALLVCKLNQKTVANIGLYENDSSLRDITNSYIEGIITYLEILEKTFPYRTLNNLSEKDQTQFDNLQTELRKIQFNMQTIGLELLSVQDKFLKKYGVNENVLPNVRINTERKLMPQLKEYTTKHGFVFNDFSTLSFSGITRSNFTGIVKINLNYYYPGGELLGKLSETEKFIHISDLFTFFVEDKDENTISTLPIGNFTIRGTVGKDDLKFLGLSENIPVYVYYQSLEAENIWTQIGNVNEDISFNKFGMFTLGVDLQGDMEKPIIQAKLQDNEVSIRIVDNIGVYRKGVMVLINGLQREYTRENDILSVQLSDYDQKGEAIYVTVYASDLARNDAQFYASFPGNFVPTSVELNETISIKGTSMETGTIINNQVEVTAKIISRYPGCDTDDILVGEYIVSACEVGSSYAQKDGKIYTWDEAQTVCTGEYYLPSRGEWETLLIPYKDSSKFASLKNDLLFSEGGRRSGYRSSTLENVYPLKISFRIGNLRGETTGKNSSYPVRCFKK